jgi:predicted amidohydrolase YtcJ
MSNLSCGFFCTFGFKLFQLIKFLPMKNIIILVLIFILFGCSNNQKKVDLILKNAKVYTVDDEFSIASVVVVENGKIMAVGKDDLLEKFVSDKEIDLHGKFVYPGFIDAHCHFYGYSMNLRQIELRGTTSFEEIIEKLKVWDKKNGGDWIVGRGWDQNDWAIKDFPTNDKLNEAFPDKPVFLRRIDGHAAIANDRALELAEIDQNFKIEGGDVLIKDGRVTGVLIDNAMVPILDMIADPEGEEAVAYLRKGEKNCFSVGLTSVVDAGLEFDQVKLLDQMQLAGDLKMQVYAMLTPTEGNMTGFVEKGIYKSERMHVRSIKLYADGALGSRGACLLEPYSDDEQNKGIIVTSKKEMLDLAKKAFDNNYQVNTHAIGDSANRLMLNLYAEILKGKNDRRWRIEHAQVIHPDDFQLFSMYNIVPAVNTTHATSDMYWAEHRLGAKRIKNAYAYGKLLKQNGWLCNGSDFPVEEINPLYGFYAAVARKDFKGYPDGGFEVENALTREQALRAMTIWAAKSMFEEKEKGSIEVGKSADLVVLEKDIMNIDEVEIFNVKVLKTYIRGEMVYSSL